AAVESAILFESGFHEGLDATLCVEAPTQTRLRRAMQRDGATQAQVEARMAHQKAEQRQRADYIVTNDSEGCDTLLPQLRHVVSELLHEEK
ncbi:MAG: dephospho-CoA kinase, partial [Bacteroidaceae bacterium]|nr:dephospho-CoA kinase [Bacteroidaceae bacterium]